MNAWLLIAAIVASTTAGDVMQSIEMKRHAQSGVAATARHVTKRPLLLLSVLCMAISFFAFLALLSIADLSFAVPATAASFVVETILASVLLKERVNPRRWAGTVLVACGVALLAL